MQVGDRVEVVGRLFAPVAAVEVGADRGVAGIAGQLANVVDVVDDARQADPLVC